MLRKRCVFRPKGMTARYRGFPYPTDHIRGTVEATLDDDAAPGTRWTWSARGAARRSASRDRSSVGPDREVDLVLTGSNIILDKTLIDALPDDYPALMHGSGRPRRGTSRPRSVTTPASGKSTGRTRSTTSLTSRSGRRVDVRRVPVPPSQPGRELVRPHRPGLPDRRPTGPPRRWGGSVPGVHRHRRRRLQTDHQRRPEGRGRGCRPGAQGEGGGGPAGRRAGQGGGAVSRSTTRGTRSTPPAG